MLYLLKVYGLVAALVFASAGMVLLGLLAWRETKAYAAAQYRIVKRVASLIMQPRYFTSPLTISRTSSRTAARGQFTSHGIQ